MKEQKHTLEPWQRHPCDKWLICHTTPTQHNPIAQIMPESQWHKENDGGMAEANAARIVACVNGCKGIANPEAVGEIVDALEDMIARCPTFAPDGKSQVAAIEAARAALAKAKGEA